ncbi:MAG: MoxR family ATPase [Candidatus Sumerlaea chitinivorans]|jgi:MoxR-like ATPase|nr:MoxR family ATPase [Candidatus Sumerlaea chitinivorans]
MNSDIQAITERVKGEHPSIERVLAEIGKVIVGQKPMIERLLIGLLTNGHVLLEGVPGLAKTLAVRTLARTIRAHFQRIQFTPDLLPADLIGTLIYKDGTFTPRKGPIFANLILADEINRAPAKVQSALLEAMQEHQVTIGDTTYSLPEPFLVLATQNPIEQEGTYPLPEAQVDRFMLKLRIFYPNKSEEKRILDRMTEGDGNLAGGGEKVLADPLQEFNVEPVVSTEDIMRMRGVVRQIYVDDKVKNYILDVIFATRQPAEYKLDIAPYIKYGASPRATIALTMAAKAYAFLRGRGHVTPDDVKTVAADVLRHRIILTYEAEAEDITSEAIIRAIFEQVPVP